jgi:hypothetical protein
MDFLFIIAALAVLVWGGLKLAAEVGERHPGPETPTEDLPDSPASPTPPIDRSPSSSTG